MINFVKFAAVLRRECGGVPMGYVVAQWKLLKSGVRDHRISDAAIHAWQELGGRLFQSS